MTNSRALIGLVVDRSGSMISCQQEMQHAVNQFLKDQGNQEYEADASLAQFDTVYELLYPPTPIQDVPEYSLVPRNGTALYDAMGKFISELGEDLKSRDEAQRPSKVIIAIITDGYENSSVEYWGEQGRRRIQEMVKHQHDKYNWDFVFLGANIDAEKVGMGLGVARGSSMTYSTQNSASTMDSLNNYVAVAAAAPMAQASFTAADRANAMDPEQSDAKKKHKTTSGSGSK